MDTLLVRRHPFRSMGTSVELIAEADVDETVFDTAARRVHGIFEREDRRCSRFRDDSEITLVNRRAGRPTRLSLDLAEVIALALQGAARSGGRFDPTVLDAVVAAGYDRDFDEVLAGARGALHPARPCGRWREVTLEGQVLRLPEGIGLDLGGVAKGWTVDLAAEAALQTGLPWAVVNAGGDLRIVGSPPRPGIDVGIEDPEAPDDEVLRLVLSGGAIATSSVTRRAWGPGLHHLIDPATGAPASTGILQATVWAPTCAEAEIGAKEALLLGETALERISAVLVTADARILTNMTERAAEAA
jgi:thiamine biosynthesis lipoprotein